jgi:general stress protein 26
MKTEMTKMFELIEGMKIGILVTRTADGSLVARPMARQKAAPGADLWFVTGEGSGKLEDLEQDPHVNVTFYGGTKQEWVSIAGMARVSRDRQLIEQLYESDWRIWFSNSGDPRDGTPEDPRMVLIGVDVHTAVFLEQDKPGPVVLFELAKGFLTGERPDVGKMHRVSESDAGREARHSWSEAEGRSERRGSDSL